MTQRATAVPANASGTRKTSPGWFKSAVFILACCVGGIALSPPIHARSIHDLNLDQPLPSFITPVTTFGQRPDWSHDGKKILFLEKTSGDVYEVEVATRELTPLTHDFVHEGFTRALYLANGDILLSGARRFDRDNPHAHRHQDNAELWVLSPGAGKPPVALGVNCREGPSVSRTQMKIAWALYDDFWMADIVYDAAGVPRLEGRKVVLTADRLPAEGTWHIEAQNFRPGKEHELIFNMFDRDDNFLSETMGLDLRTGDIVNYSRRPDRYDEPEGIFPDGRRILVESSRHRHDYKDFRNFGPIDLYVLALNGSGDMVRLTFFNDDERFKASQGVISDDGRFMAFQISRTADTTGYGYGIMLMDIEAYTRTYGIKLP
jgi:hypothetical protein